MATEKNHLLQALSVVDGLGESSGVEVDKRAELWDVNCLKLSDLIHDWSGGAIRKHALRDRDRVGPRCFRVHDYRQIYPAVFKRELYKLEGLKHLAVCSNSEYADTLLLLLRAEEVHQAVEMRKCDLMGYTIAGISNRYSHSIHLPGLSERSPAIVANDYVLLKDNSSYFYMATKIESIQGDHVKLQDSLRLRQKLRRPLEIHFVSSGYPFMQCENAILELQRSPIYQSIVFEDVGEPQYREKIDVTATNNYERQWRLDDLNENQRQAVTGILQAKCRPKPYILFGPPGTGKTHTLVKAIVQVYLRLTRALDYDSDEDLFAFTSAKVLVCVNSNTCANVLHAMLESELPGARILRLHAGSGRTELSGEKIVVTTNIKAGSLKEKFDYVFIDEAGHANSAESLVPISKLQDNGCLVLSGDPKQLGPVVMCREAGALGLDISLLERLFKFRLYRRDPQTGQYDSNYITMLQDCYRCDARILAPCNKLFYNGDLRCLNETPKSLLKLLKLSGPVQVKYVSGQETKRAGSTSWQNEEEARACIDVLIRLYRVGIEPDQVGITTPYKSQNRLIRRTLRERLVSEATWIQERFHKVDYEEMKEGQHADSGEKYYDTLDGIDYFEVPLGDQSPPQKPLYVKKKLNWSCKVDSIDAFQGNEKEVMIISTVRTGCDSRLDFLNDARRFNVAVSRAKWLLIVVGSSSVLELGEYWPKLIRAAKQEFI